MNHPLTPLTPSEIAKTTEIVKKKKKNAHFVYVGAQESPALVYYPTTPFFLLTKIC